MNVKQLFQDEDAVSPVIGVILMVAITVILAAVIGTFVLGLGDQVQSSSPNANFQFEYSGDWSGSAAGLTVTHNGGQDIDTANLEIQVGAGSAGTGDFTGAWNNGGSGSVTVSTGDSTYLSEDGSNVDGNNAFGIGDQSTGADVRVIWTSPSGDSSNTIGSSTVPN